MTMRSHYMTAEFFSNHMVPFWSYPKKHRTAHSIPRSLPQNGILVQEVWHQMPSAHICLKCSGMFSTLLQPLSLLHFTTSLRSGSEHTAGVQMHAFSMTGPLHTPCCALLQPASLAGLSPGPSLLPARPAKHRCQLRPGRLPARHLEQSFHVLHASMCEHLT